MPNPKSRIVFQPGDRIGLLGDQEEIAAVERVLTISGTTDIAPFKENRQNDE
jgi:hypothetical protein